MRRRTFLVGAGSVVAGAGALASTGAYTAAELERGASINVVNDADGLLGLVVGPNVGSDVVREDGGEFTIDFTAGGNAGGVNIGSRYQVGVFDSDYDKVPNGALDAASGASDDDYAFAVLNQDTVDHDVRVAYEANDTDDFHGSSLFFQCVPRGSGNTGTHGIYLDETYGNNVDAFSNTIPSGGSYRLSLLVDTRGAAGHAPSDVDLSGRLVVSAD